MPGNLRATSQEEKRMSIVIGFMPSLADHHIGVPEAYMAMACLQTATL